MKKIFILSILAFGLIGCETYNRVPYSGTMGNYGFTHDLDSSPSPFVDTSYRPLTAYDLAAPIIVVVTNQPPPRVVYREAPPIGETIYAGETPTRPGPIAATSPTIIESAGAQPGQGAGAGVTGGGVVGAAPGYGGPGYGYGGSAVLLGGTNVVSTNTNVNNITNTNGFGFVTNTNILGGITNTNVAGGTNPLINEPAGTELQTNRPFGEPPGTQFRTNRFGEPAVPPPAATNRVLFTPPPVAQPPPAQPPPVQTPIQTPPGFRAPPVQRPMPQPLIPPASAPQSPPAPQGAPSAPGGAATP